MPGLAIWRGIGWVHALQTDFRAGARSDVPGSGITRALESVESAGIAASYFGYGRGDARPRGGFLAAADRAGGLWPFFFWQPLALLLLIAGGGLATASIALWRWRRR
jgi:hypothetical protein